MQKERKRQVFVKPQICSQHRLSSFTKLRLTQEVHLFCASTEKQAGGRIFQSHALLALLSRYPLKSVVKIFPSVSETRACRAHPSIPHTEKRLLIFMYHLDCVRSMIWRPKGHFDQPSPLGELLTSRILVKPTAQLVRWCRLLKKQRRSCWCVRLLPALLQVRQLWNRTTGIAQGRRTEWWGYFGLAQYIRQHQLSCQGLG